MKVFVSGTTADLGSYREAVAKTLDMFRDYGVEKIEQTSFSMNPGKLVEQLKDKIKQCDAVICLVGSVFGAAPAGSPRSYTQMEYDFARDFGKPVYAFFPSSRCEIKDEGSDTPEQREWQKEHAARVRAEGYMFWDFESDADVRQFTGRVVFDISPKAASGPLVRATRSDYPTPLARLFEASVAEDHSHDALLWSLTADSLRFVSLLAFHDSVVHGIFGRDSADRKELSRILARPEDASDWRSLLRLACPDQNDRSGARFITEFEGWARRNSERLDALVRYDAAMRSGGVTEANRMVAKVRRAITAVFAELGFLRRYVLVAIANVDANAGRSAVTVFRGGVVSSFIDLALDRTSAHQVTENHLYLLNVDRGRALWLAPSLEYRPEAAEEGICGWDGLARNQDDGVDRSSECVTTVRGFPKDQRLCRRERRALLSAWLGEQVCEDAFGFHDPADRVEWTFRLFDAASWTRIREIVLPPGGEPPVLAERFRLAPAPLYRGDLGDVFEATDIASAHATGGQEEPVAVPRQPVVHLLRADRAADPEVLELFENRSECWRRVQHPAVLRLDESGDPGGTKGLPFLVTERVPDCRNLEALMRPGESIGDEILKKVIVLAAEICRAAHEQGVFLLTLPPRHFLIDSRDSLFVTGFESARLGRTGDEVAPALQASLLRLCKDHRLLAPEIRRDFATFAPTLDVFAIGKLLAELREPATRHGDDRPDADWSDPWWCLTFHCLAPDVHMRFQSADQVLMFLNDGAPRLEPQTVEVQATATERGFSIGKYPVTNVEYRQFCSDNEYPLPPHLSARGRQDDEQWSERSRRLNGPWLPVTYVSLVDAEQYCRWLSKRTHRRWRLPTSNEWRRAAACDSSTMYPWGNDAPDRQRSNYGSYYRGPTVVGGFPRGRSHANCWDMAGNVWEWCTDMLPTGAPRRVVKGGAYDYSHETLQVWDGGGRVVACRSAHLGFRVLCEEAP